MRLIVSRGTTRGTAIPITRSTFVIGRDESCQLRPRSEQVSRFHAALSVTGGVALLRDLESRNGTRLNGITLTDAVRLKDGDRIEIGPLSFTVRLDQMRKPRRPRRPAEDEIAAWLIDDDDAFDDDDDNFDDVSAGETLVSDAPRATPAKVAPPALSDQDALDLIEIMSIDL